MGEWVEKSCTSFYPMMTEQKLPRHIAPFIFGCFLRATHARTPHTHTHTRHLLQELLLLFTVSHGRAQHIDTAEERRACINWHPSYENKPPPFRFIFRFTGCKHHSRIRRVAQYTTTYYFESLLKFASTLSWLQMQALKHLVAAGLALYGLSQQASACSCALPPGTLCDLITRTDVVLHVRAISR